jgi:hypothetical protein
VEWAFSDDVDWVQVRQIALGNVPVINNVPMKQSLVYWVLQVVRLRGFDWTAFDPTQPQTFVDSLEHMLPLCAEHHRAPDKGIHMTTFPLWVFQSFPKKAGMHEFS